MSINGINFNKIVKLRKNIKTIQNVSVFQIPS